MTRGGSRLKILILFFIRGYLQLQEEILLDRREYYTRTVWSRGIMINARIRGGKRNLRC